ncbi:universal stress protein [Haladaptatus sp. CMSO5]|uniref:universal stress protein n=1 Tax=Haladaptatus sp. CMSO5 TaxID=3120514 RepID=UPI002FCDF070
MIDSVVIATDGSASVERAVTVALDLANRFDATVHALYVIDDSEIDTAPDSIRAEFRDALEDAADEALAAVKAGAAGEVVTAIETGRPANVICEYARDNDIDVVATGTRGRHGEHRFLLGSVAETVVRRCSVPVLTVRQLEGEASQ